jgi:NitT/TauT family transport system substrate-binding protein
MNLRPVHALLLFSTLVTSCHKSAANTNGLNTITLQTDWYPQPEMGGFYEAQSEGLYKAAGLDVTIAPGGPYVSAEQEVASGKAQFAMGSSDQVLVANSHGLPLVAVAATMQQDPQAIMVHAESPVHTFADLNGHAVAARPGSIWFQYLVHRYGLSNVREIPATYSLSNFLHDPGYIQQIFVTSEPYFAQKEGAQVRTLLISATGYQPYRVTFTSQQFLKAHPDLVQKFTDASLQGWKDYIANPGPINAQLQKLNPNMSPDLMNFSINTLKSDRFLTGDDTPASHLGHMEPDRWTTLYQQLVDLKVITQPFDPRQAYTTQFVP